MVKPIASHLVLLFNLQDKALALSEKSKKGFVGLELVLDLIRLCQEVLNKHEQFLDRQDIKGSLQILENLFSRTLLAIDKALESQRLCENENEVPDR